MPGIYDFAPREKRAFPKSMFGAATRAATQAAKQVAPAAAGQFSAFAPSAAKQVGAALPSRIGAWAGRNKGNLIAGGAATLGAGYWGATTANAPQDLVTDQAFAKQNIDSLKAGGGEKWDLFRNTFGGIGPSTMGEKMRQDRIAAWEKKFHTAGTAIQQGEQAVSGSGLMDRIANPFGMGRYNQDELNSQFKANAGQDLKMRLPGQPEQWFRDSLERASLGERASPRGYSATPGTGIAYNR